MNNPSIEYDLGSELQKVPEELREVIQGVANHLWHFFQEPLTVQEFYDSEAASVLPEWVVVVQSHRDASEALRLLDDFSSDYWDEASCKPGYERIIPTVEFPV
jgi:hypothetical protein